MTQEVQNPAWPGEDSPVTVIRTGDNYVAVFKNDIIMPVTDWFDKDGEDCEPEEAFVCVAGADGFGWITITLGNPVRLN